MTEVIKIARRSKATLVPDFIGVISLAVVLIGSLYLPALL